MTPTFTTLDEVADHFRPADSQSCAINYVTPDGQDNLCGDYLDAVAAFRAYTSRKNKP